MSFRSLPQRPDIDQLRRQAKGLLESYRTGDAAATAEVRRHYRDAHPETFALHDAQLVVARSYNFASWPKLKAHVDGVTVHRLVDAVKANDIAAARALLKQRPELATMDLHEHDEHQALHFAVLARNAEMVRLLMQNGANARKGVYPHRDASSPYTIASERGFADMIAVIEEEESKSAYPRPYTGGKPMPPEIAEAARVGDQDAIIAYLESHPELQNYVEYLLTPLHRASMMLWDRVAAWLIEHGADVNARIDGGPSPLEIAGCGYGVHMTAERARPTVELLLSRGAEMTPRAAVTHGDLDAIRRMHAQGRLINRLPRNQGPRGLLEIAVQMNRMDSLLLLLDLGFDPNEPLVLNNGESSRGGPLRAAREAGRAEMAELLLARGAELSPLEAVALGRGDWLRKHYANGLNNDTGLVMTAVTHDRADILEVLLDLGFPADDFDGSPLLHCAGNGKHALAETLLRRGANPSLQPAMFYAHRNRDAEMVALLARYGAQVTPETPCYLRDVEGARAMLAADESVERAVEMLDGAATGGSPEILAMVFDRIDSALRHAPLPEAYSRSGGDYREDSRWFGILRSAMTLWHEVPWIRRDDWKLDRTTHVECVRLLLTKCSPNVRNPFGITPLHEAAALGDWVTDAEVNAFATLLLDAGARTDTRDEMLHSTPLGWACRWGRAELVKLLLARGADPLEHDAEPWATPIAWSKKMGHAGIVHLLK